MKLKILLFASMIALLASCSKGKTEESLSIHISQGPLAEAGYGNSNMTFAGTAWQLPAGVELEDSIHDYSYCWAFPPNTQVPPKDWKGVPLGFTFCLTLNNTTTHPITIVFPPQLVFASSSVLHQNILTIELGTLELPAAGAKTIVAQGFCVNQGRSIPQTFDEATGNFLSYTFGPSVIPAALQEVVDIVRSKHITMNDILKPDGSIDNSKTGKYVVIQTAIWEITEQQGLTANTKNLLLAL